MADLTKHGIKPPRRALLKHTLTLVDKEEVEVAECYRLPGHTTLWAKITKTVS